MDIIITKEIMVCELIDELKKQFDESDIVTTGLWIRKK